MRKTLSLLFAAAIGMTSLFALTSCGDDNDDPKPSKNQWTLTVGGKTTTYSVKTLGVYHESGQGFDMLFCDQDVEIFSKMPQPDCNWLDLFFPEDILDKVITKPKDLDGSDWLFYCQSNVGDPNDPFDPWDTWTIKSCQVSIKNPSTGNFNIKMSLTLNNGDKLSLNYDGNAKILGEYITDLGHFYLHNEWWSEHINHFSCEVKSAGIYHGDGGYNMLICDDENISYKSDMSQPSCDWVRLDFPDEMVNKIVNTPGGLDGEEWSFYFQSSLTNRDVSWDSNKISKCYCKVTKKDGGKFKIYMDLKFKGEDDFALEADIKPTVVGDYITSSSTW